MIFSVLLLLLLHKCVFACATVCACARVCVCTSVCAYARVLAEPRINKAGHGSCTWPLMINRRSTIKRRNI